MLARHGALTKWETKAPADAAQELRVCDGVVRQKVSEPLTAARASGAAKPGEMLFARVEQYPGMLDTLQCTQQAPLDSGNAMSRQLLQIYRGSLQVGSTIAEGVGGGTPKTGVTNGPLRH